jgi:hypothetical protein
MFHIQWYSAQNTSVWVGCLSPREYLGTCLVGKVPYLRYLTLGTLIRSTPVGLYLLHVNHEQLAT